MSLITFLETKKTDNGKLFFKLIEKKFMRKTIMNITCKWRESIQVTCKISAETLKPIWERNNCSRNWQSSIYTNFTINRQNKKITKTTNFIQFWLLNTLYRLNWLCLARINHQKPFLIVLNFLSFFPSKSWVRNGKKVIFSEKQKKLFKIN